MSYKLIAIGLILYHLKSNAIVGPAKYSCDPKFATRLGSGVVLQVGKFQTVRPVQWRLSLLADVAHTPFLEEVDVLGFVDQAFAGRADLKRGFTDDQQRQLLRVWL